MMVTGKKKIEKMEKIRKEIKSKNRLKKGKKEEDDVA